MGKKKSQKQLKKLASMTDDEIKDKVIYDWSTYRNTHVGANHADFIKLQTNHYQQLRSNAQQKLAPKVQQTEPQMQSAGASLNKQNQQTTVPIKSIGKENEALLSSNKPIGNDIDFHKEQASKSVEQPQLIGKQSADENKQQPNEQSAEANRADNTKSRDEADSEKQIKQKPSETKTNKSSRRVKKKTIDTNLQKANKYLEIVNGVQPALETKDEPNDSSSVQLRFPNKQLIDLVRQDIVDALAPDKEKIKQDLNIDLDADYGQGKGLSKGMFLVIFIGGNLFTLSKEQLGVSSVIYSIIQMYRQRKQYNIVKLSNKKYNRLYSNQMDLRNTIDSIMYLLTWYMGRVRFNFTDTPESAMGHSKDQLENFDVMTGQTKMLVKTIKDQLTSYNKSNQEDKYRSF